MMQVIRYTVRFTTPAFLGNAEQSSQWRTPPFKALLRHWWRVVWAADHGFEFKDLKEDLRTMREEEARLFGAASDHHAGTANRQSMVRLRLDTWSEGKETREQWERKRTSDEKIHHSEVGKPAGSRIDPLLYLGYGPLKTWRDQQGPHSVRRGAPGTSLKHNAAIQAGESAKLSIAAPDGCIPSIRDALALMNAYGTIGGRSRNGWGSFCLLPEDQESDERKSARPTDLSRFFRSWKSALNLDWPHAIGLTGDGKSRLVWQTVTPYGDWESAMRDLAIIKIDLRTEFRFWGGGRHPQPQDRHWLSYPITNHKVGGWENLRLPNSLRFKVRPAPGNDGKLRGTIFHVPCLPPQGFNPEPERQVIESIWSKVHHFLDQCPKLERA